jgi:thioredoxin 1
VIRPREATDENFEAEVLGSELAVVEFRAPWCEASRLLSRSVARLAETHGHRIGFFRVNTDENPKTVARCVVRSIPAVVVFRAGTIVKRDFGFESLASLRSMLEDVLTWPSDRP